MEDFFVQLFGPAFNEWPMLLRPVLVTIVLLIVVTKLIFYFVLPTVAVVFILTGAAALVTILIREIWERFLKKDRNETRKKSDDETRILAGLRGLEAGGVKY
ncbi:hypothetical protein PENNAL_c0010G12098 [Penicillium nalgiovense]|uniref:Uncharacterized protein n=1 Tax=Penicillium nalgiovense TaxID=60175 RepID=A0A1V6YUQ8_PENNA|nr:hypothetical protein PENNAL_c0010G12098 [Penicillium nalgiovense]